VPFSVRVAGSDGKPVGDIGVMVDYGILGGIEERRTHRDGWVEFHNHGAHPGTIWTHGEEMGDHSLVDGRTYSFSI
jgi:hypothetical protein